MTASGSFDNASSQKIKHPGFNMAHLDASLLDDRPQHVVQQEGHCKTELQLFGTQKHTQQHKSHLAVAFSGTMPTF
jgi:hypothetical protein|tara:strand:+ start:1685 stop:1912 length:228 start_codon:yes stop_codon:yes gene_type:complete